MFISGGHVVGHDEHPWNEFANVVAKHTSRRHVRLGFGARLIEPWVTSRVDDLQWAWFFQRQYDGFDPAFPPIVGDTMVVAKTAPYVWPSLTLPGISAPEGSRTAIDLDLRLAAVNVRLSINEDDRSVVGHVFVGRDAFFQEFLW